MVEYSCDVPVLNIKFSEPRHVSLSNRPMSKFIVLLVQEGEHVAALAPVPEVNSNLAFPPDNVADLPDADRLDECLSPVLQLADPCTAAASSKARYCEEDDSDGEGVDEEISVDPTPARVTRDVGQSTTTPTVCHFASPPLVFQRTRQPPRPLPTVARPRTLGEFLTAAKSRSDALLQTPAVRRRLVELNF
jgi:hypothetical protein